MSWDARSCTEQASQFFLPSSTLKAILKLCKTQLGQWKVSRSDTSIPGGSLMNECMIFTTSLPHCCRNTEAPTPPHPTQALNKEIMCAETPAGQWWTHSTRQKIKFDISEHACYCSRTQALLTNEHDFLASLTPRVHTV